MDFKCFMKLLIEKGYIKPLRKYDLESEIEDGYIAIDYECKYKEVKQRIIKEIEDWQKTDWELRIDYQTKGMASNKIKIINIDKLEKHIHEKMQDKEMKSFEKSEMGYIDLNDILKYNEYYSARMETIGEWWYITDLSKKNAREKKENKEKEECLEFLRQLP